ncbi:MAG: glycosyltransferase [Halobacteriota archaeon]
MKILMILSKEVTTDDRVCREAKALIEDGHEVTVIVWDRHRDYEPDSIVDGISVERIHNKGIMKILPNDLLRNPLWWRRAYKKGLELYKTGFRFDIVHCHDLDTLQAGAWLKKKLGLKLIYDSHEIFSYMIEGNVPNIVTNASASMEKRLVNKDVDYMITVNVPFKEYFSKFIQKPISIIMNCKDPVKEYIPPNNAVFSLIYIGTMHGKRFFPDIIDVIGGIENVKLVIASKKERLYEVIKERSKKYNNIDFLGTIPSQQVLPETLKADATFVIADPTDKKLKINPFCKQFEAMACGRPIICTKGTWCGDLTERLKCGLTVDYNKESVKEAIITLRDNPELCEELDKNALKAAKEKYNWENEKEKLLKVYESIY